MTFDHFSCSNEKIESRHNSERVESNSNLCLASLADGKNALGILVRDLETVLCHLPELSIDFGYAGREEHHNCSERRVHHGGHHWAKPLSGLAPAPPDAPRAATPSEAPSVTPARQASAYAIPSEAPSVTPAREASAHAIPSEAPSVASAGKASAPAIPSEAPSVAAVSGLKSSAPADSVTPTNSTHTKSPIASTPLPRAGIAGDITSSSPSTLGRIDGFTVGIDGHSDWYGSSYDNLTAQQTIDAVKNMGLAVYAFDVNAGNPKNDKLIAAAKQDNIGLIGSIGAAPRSFDNAKDAYNQSYATAAKLGTEYGSGIKTWQLSNETDAWAMANPQNFQIAESEMKGLIAGLKSIDPSAETMINTTNGTSGGKFLNQLKADGVNWDITGYHAYTQAGDVAGSGETTLADVAALGKPIYISELNGWNSGNLGPGQLPNNPQLLTNSLDSIRSVAKQDNIIGVNFYELLNQPEISGSEGGFGVLKADGSATASSKAITAYMQANRNA